MRTTMRIDDDLLRRAKKRAAAEGRTLTSVLEDALALIVAKPKARSQKRARVPVSQASGGVLPGIDLNRSSDLEEVMGAP
jgi:predicted transcriptional regulator